MITRERLAKLHASTFSVGPDAKLTSGELRELVNVYVKALNDLRSEEDAIKAPNNTGGDS